MEIITYVRAHGIVVPRSREGTTKFCNFTRGLVDSDYISGSDLLL